jgi:CHASE2 domain-containing sensor protein
VAGHAPFTVVMIDAKTEALYGAMPLNRKFVAEVVQKLAVADVKGIVLKFFYDVPSSEESDRALEKSICTAPVALQTCLNEREGTANSLDAKFQFPGDPPPGLLSGAKGLIPLSRFLQCAQGVGFVDHTALNEVPLVESYQGAMVKSLYLVALEMSNNCKARIDQGGDIYLDKQRLTNISNGRHTVTLPVSTRPK